MSEAVLEDALEVKLTPAEDRMKADSLVEEDDMEEEASGGGDLLLLNNFIDLDPPLLVSISGKMITVLSEFYDSCMHFLTNMKDFFRILLVWNPCWGSFDNLFLGLFEYPFR